MEYSSVQLITVKNTTLALTYYAVMILVLGYIAYSMISEKQYQLVDPLVADTFLKVKGSAHTADGTVWDQYDMVVPPILPDAVFIGTNFILTPNQTQTECAGVEEMCDCDKGSVSLCCPEGEHTESGMYTGQCNKNGVHCEMRGWCPFETKPADKEQNVLIGVDKWTLFARTSGHFPAFNSPISNTAETPLTPDNGISLFTVGGMIREAGFSFDDMNHKGGIILISMRYDCNLDRNEVCNPTVSFERLDDPEDGLSSGFNFRHIQTNRAAVVSRDLWKLYGIYVVFQVHGVAGKFDIVTFLTSMGALAAYFSMATLVCDLFLQYLHPKRNKLMTEKFRSVRASSMPASEIGSSLNADLLA